MKNAWQDAAYLCRCVSHPRVRPKTINGPIRWKRRKKARFLVSILYPSMPVVSYYPIGAGMSCWISRTRRMRKVRLFIMRLSERNETVRHPRIVYCDRDTHQKCCLYDIFAVVQFYQDGRTGQGRRGDQYPASVQ